MSLEWFGYAVAILGGVVVVVGAITFLMAGKASGKASGKNVNPKQDAEHYEQFAKKIKGEVVGDDE